MKIEDFEVLNVSKDCLKQDGENIVIRTSSGSMWSKGNTCRNLLLSPDVLTDLNAELSVQLLPENNAEQAGLILFADWDNYIKLVREMVSGEQVLVLAREIEGEAVPAIVECFDSPIVHLKICTIAGQLSVEWKSPGASSYTKRDFENWLGSDRKVKVGIFVHGANENNHAVFSSLKIQTLTP